MQLPGGDKRIECVVCKGEVDLRRDIYADHDCGIHYSHIGCHDEDGDFECVACVPTASAAHNRAPLREVPTPHDYIDHPLQPSMRTKLRRKLTFATDHGRHVEDSGNPFYWLNQRTSLEWLLRNKQGKGLQYMLGQGIQINDFLDNGYTLNDLMIYQDLSKRGPERARRALYALGVTADHLIEYKHAMPMSLLQGEAFELRPPHITKYMGVGFHPTEGLRSLHTDAWQVGDMIYLGFNFDDLVKSGMTTRDLWDDLGPPTMAETKALGATLQDVAALPYEEELYPENNEEFEPIHANDDSYSEEYHQDDINDHAMQQRIHETFTRAHETRQVSRAPVIPDTEAKQLQAKLQRSQQRQRRKKHAGLKK